MQNEIKFVTYLNLNLDQTGSEIISHPLYFYAELFNLVSAKAPLKRGTPLEIQEQKSA